MEQQGCLDGQAMADSFRLLRPNSLIWHYVIHNYLLGETPPPLGVLYWNCHSTRMPQAMHSFYLREFYLHNRLIQPDGLTLGGRTIDLGRVTAPLYAMGAEQDHIAPWLSTFKVCDAVGGEVRFALSTSGHVMGVVNPPSNPPKRHYWAADATAAGDADAWRDSSERLAGSWWDDWAEWLGQQCGEMVAARDLGSKKLPVLCDAPGSYVLE